MLTVVCVRWGTQFGVEYVERLHDMVRRNLPEGFEGRFVCLTERPEDIKSLAGVETALLPAGLSGWWNKMALFKPGLLAPGRVLYFDLDTVIVGPLDRLAAFDCHLGVLRDVYRPDGYQTSIMFFRAGTPLTDSIWDEFEKRGNSPALEWPGGDQEFLERFYREYLPQRLEAAHGKGSKPWPPEMLQEYFPGMLRSYKQDCIDGPPRGTSVVFFHGRPRPHEAGGWVEKIWNTGVGSPTELVMIPNVPQAVVLENVRDALRDGRCDFIELSEPHTRPCVIVGGAPSLKNYLGTIAFMQRGGAVVLALNGTDRYLREHRIVADAHVVCDAKPHSVAWYCPGGKKLYASMVDPGLREKAHMDPEAELTVWHPLTDGIEKLVPDGAPLFGGGSTVAMRALTLAYGMGFRRFHLFGIDSSYAADAHHVYAQPANDAERVLDMICEGRAFKAAPWMVQQAEDFRRIVPALLREGCEVYVFGEGLIPCIAEHMKPLAVDQRAAAILERLPPGPVRGVEVGVFAGDLSRRLLARADLYLTMVDSWSTEHPVAYVATGDYHTGMSAAEQSAAQEIARGVTDFASNRRRIIAQDSVQVAREISDQSLDFVFIDADHSYEGCRADLRAWLPKVRPGGLLCGHDYDNPDFPGFGVKQAVDELLGNVELGANFTWFKRIPHG